MIAVIAVAAGIAVLTAIVAVASHNRFVSGANRVRSAWSQIDAELLRRHQLVPQLVEVVRAAAARERSTIEHLVAVSAAQQSASGPAGRGSAESSVRQAWAGVIAIGEAMPDLHSQQNFLQLQGQLTMVEDRLAAARRFYNSRLVELNRRVEAFPSSIIRPPGRHRAGRLLRSRRTRLSRVR